VSPPAWSSVFGLLAVAACGQDPHIVWTLISEMPEGARLESRRVTLPEESILAARATVVVGDDVLPCVPELASRAPELLYVEPAQRGATVFVGVEPGRTSIWVRCDNEAFGIDARVVPASE
jgi:hypothetical protein